MKQKQIYFKKAFAIFSGLFCLCFMSSSLQAFTSALSTKDGTSAEPVDQAKVDESYVEIDNSKPMLPSNPIINNDNDNNTTTISAVFNDPDDVFTDPVSGEVIHNTASGHINFRISNVSYDDCINNGAGVIKRERSSGSVEKGQRAEIVIPILSGGQYYLCMQSEDNAIPKDQTEGEKSAWARGDAFMTDTTPPEINIKPGFENVVSTNPLFVKTTNIYDFILEITDDTGVVNGSYVIRDIINMNEEEKDYKYVDENGILKDVDYLSPIKNQDVYLSSNFKGGQVIIANAVDTAGNIAVKTFFMNIDMKPIITLDKAGWVNFNNETLKITPQESVQSSAYTRFIIRNGSSYNLLSGAKNEFAAGGERYRYTLTKDEIPVGVWNNNSVKEVLADGVLVLGEEAAILEDGKYKMYVEYYDDIMGDYTDASSFLIFVDNTDPEDIDLIFSESDADIISSTSPVGTSRCTQAELDDLNQKLARGQTVFSACVLALSVSAPYVPLDEGEKNVETLNAIRTEYSNETRQENKITFYPIVVPLTNDVIEIKDENIITDEDLEEGESKEEKVVDMVTDQYVQFHYDDIVLSSLLGNNTSSLSEGSLSIFGEYAETGIDSKVERSSGDVVNVILKDEKKMSQSEADTKKQEFKNNIPNEYDSSGNYKRVDQDTKQEKVIYTTGVSVSLGGDGVFIDAGPQKKDDKKSNQAECTMNNFGGDCSVGLNLNDVITSELVKSTTTEVTNQLVDYEEMLNSSKEDEIKNNLENEMKIAAEREITQKEQEEEPVNNITPASENKSIILKINASGHQYNGAPKMEVTIDGVNIANEVITSDYNKGESKEYFYNLTNIPAKLEIKFPNDAYKKGVGDRNLIINSVKINNTELSLLNAVFRYNKGDIPGIMRWQGKMVFNLTDFIINGDLSDTNKVLEEFNKNKEERVFDTMKDKINISEEQIQKFQEMWKTLDIKSKYEIFEKFSIPVQQNAIVVGNEVNMMEILRGYILEGKINFESLFGMVSEINSKIQSQPKPMDINEVRELWMKKFNVGKEFDHKSYMTFSMFERIWYQLQSNNQTLKSDIDSIEPNMSNNYKKAYEFFKQLSLVDPGMQAENINFNVILTKLWGKIENGELSLDTIIQKYIWYDFSQNSENSDRVAEFKKIWDETKSLRDRFIKISTDGSQSIIDKIFKECGMYFYKQEGEVNDIVILRSLWENISNNSLQSEKTQKLYNFIRKYKKYFSGRVSVNEVFEDLSSNQKVNKDYLKNFKALWEKMDTQSKMEILGTDTAFNEEQMLNNLLKKIDSNEGSIDNFYKVFLEHYNRKQEIKNTGVGTQYPLTNNNFSPGTGALNVKPLPVSSQ